MSRVKIESQAAARSRAAGIEPPTMYRKIFVNARSIW